MNANVTMSNQYHYLTGLPNIQQENLFEAEGILKIYNDLQDIGKVNLKSKRDILYEVDDEMVED